MAASLLTLDPGLDVTAVDFTDAGDVRGFATLMLAAAGNAGMFLSPGLSSPDARAIRVAAREWICRVKEVIDTVGPGDALGIISVFDLMHRMAYGIDADEAYVDKYRLLAFERYIRGDGGVDRYSLFQTVSQQVRRRKKAFLDTPLRWRCHVLDKWYRQFQSGVCHDGLDDLDTVQRVRMLMASDLWAFETRNESAFKKKLFESHCHYLDETAGMDLKMLTATSGLLGVCAGYLNPAGYLSREESIFRAILSLPNANRYLKASAGLRLREVPQKRS